MNAWLDSIRMFSRCPFRCLRFGLLLLLLAPAFFPANADVALLMEQPYGKLGFLSPTGHAAIYLSRICAETPTKLRHCQANESGVVISRYNKVGNYDWVAVPLLPYLYAVDDPSQIPTFTEAGTITRLQDAYRREHLEKIAPDLPGGGTPKGEWSELVGSAYIRQIVVFEIETTPEQDDLLMRQLNTLPNHRKFNFFFRNCANFSQSVLNLYFPHAIRRNYTADLGLTTPKQIARSLVHYAHKHRDLHFSVFEIPQVPGKIERSGKICGVVEALLKQKQYAVPLLVLHPYVTAVLAGTYVTRGRFNPSHNALLLDKQDVVEALLHDEVPETQPESDRAKKVSILSTDTCSASGCSEHIAESAALR